MERKSFVELLEKISVQLSNDKLDRLDKYYEILVEWNKFMNLTGITEYSEVLVKHFADSIALNKAITDLSGGKYDLCKCRSNEYSCIDVGTGAGFPGLPLKIAFEGLNITLLDSLNKRVKFLNEVITSLELENICTIHARAEDGARNPHLREQFDIGVSRAVANLSTLCEYVLPFVKVGGYFVAYKSGEIEEEAGAASNAIKLLGGEVVNTYKFTIPDTDIERSFVFVKKVKPTSKKYPRKSGLPAKEPLK